MWYRIAQIAAMESGNDRVNNGRQKRANGESYSYKKIVYYTCKTVDIDEIQQTCRSLIDISVITQRIILNKLSSLYIGLCLQ